MTVKHYLQFKDLGFEECHYLFQRAIALKQMWLAGKCYRPLDGKVMTMIFDKPSTRTRVSFEAGMAQLGGHAIFLDSKTSQLERGEPIPDTARVLARMSDIMMMRTYQHSTIEQLALNAGVPVINGLTNDHHPCQVLADILTFIEHRGDIAGKTVAWIGDGNNMCRTWAQAAQQLNFNLRIASPQGYELPLLDTSFGHLCPFTVTDNPQVAVCGADLVTTDVFTSMGFEAEIDQRRAAFAKYQVTPELMQRANKGALFMHCLPARRGEEVAADVIDGPQSVVWDEAENRLHIQKALIEYLLLGQVDGSLIPRSCQ